VGARTGVTTNFDPDSLYGLPRSEFTIAELLATAGYDSAQAGKWHLGTHPGFHPSYRGFKQTLTVPYSVDMGCLGPGSGPNWNLPQPPPCATGPNQHPNGDASPALPLYNVTTNCSGTTNGNCNAGIVQQPVVEDSLDANYAQFIGDFIRAHPAGSGSAPFFAYMPFSHTHVPLFHSPEFTNTSSKKTHFGDTVMEMDHTVKMLLQAVRESGNEENTLVLFTGDNGPWAVKCELAGSAGKFKGEYQKKLGGGSPFKDTTWEGGQREAGIAYWKGKIAPGTVSNATTSTLDYLPTILALAGVPLPTDRLYDGVDLAPVLFGPPTATVRDFLFMGDTIGIAGNITAVRYKNLKAYTRTYSQPGCNEAPAPPVDHPNYLVFDLDADPGESTPVTPDAATMATIFQAHAAYLASITSSYRSVTNYTRGTSMVGSAPCCNPANAVCRCNAD